MRAQQTSAKRFVLNACADGLANAAAALFHHRALAFASVVSEPDSSIHQASARAEPTRHVYPTLCQAHTHTDGHAHCMTSTSPRPLCALAEHVNYLIRHGVPTVCAHASASPGQARMCAHTRLVCRLQTKQSTSINIWMVTVAKSKLVDLHTLFLWL